MPAATRFNPYSKIRKPDPTPEYLAEQEATRFNILSGRTGQEVMGTPTYEIPSQYLPTTQTDRFKTTFDRFALPDPNLPANAVPVSEIGARRTRRPEFVGRQQGTTETLTPGRNQTPFDEQNAATSAAYDAYNQNLQAITDEYAQGAGGATSPDNVGQYLDYFPDPTGTFAANPFVGELQQSLSRSLANPDPIDDATAQALKEQARETILKTAQDNRQRLSENLARRGISDSGLQAAVAAQLDEQAGQDIAEAERDVDIQRALARRESEVQAQQLAAALTGQYGQVGLGEQSLGQRGTATGLGLGLDAASLEIGVNNTIAQLRSNKAFFVPDVLSEFEFNYVEDLYREAQDQAKSEEDRALFWNILGLVLGPLANTLTSSLMRGGF